jgi:large subunit ribosomal protein L23
MNKLLDEERLLQVLLVPTISEKATYLADRNNQLMFSVLPRATKPEISAAIEFLFNVKVKAVQVVNRKGKVKRRGGVQGVTSDRKLAFICLEDGQEIDFSSVGKVI